MHYQHIPVVSLNDIIIQPEILLHLHFVKHIYGVGWSVCWFVF
jgi:hypothetical protein